MGQESAPGKCVLLSTSKEVKRDMRSWGLSDAGRKCTVNMMLGIWAAILIHL